MAYKASRQIAAGVSTIHPSQGNALVPVIAEYVFTAPLLVNDVIEMLGVSSQMILVDAAVICDDLDTGAGIVLDVGVLSGSYGKPLNDDNVTQRTCGNEILAGTTIGQTGGVAPMNKATAAFITPTPVPFSLGFKIVAIPAGFIANTRLRLVAYLVPAPTAM